MENLKNKIGWKTATAIVISNMIGTGVFTTLGFQVVELQNTITIFLLWFIGGVLALFGAFCYAELGTFFKEHLTSLVRIVSAFIFGSKILLCFQIHKLLKINKEIT